MRKAEKEIKDKGEMERILREAKFGRLGTCAYNQPYVIPVCFVYHEGKIYLHCANEGKKLENISNNPQVCFEVDSGEIVEGPEACKFSTRYESVIAFGEARVQNKPEEMFHALKLLMSKYAQKEVVDTLTMDKVMNLKNLSTVEITIKEMTGKRNRK